MVSGGHTPSCAVQRGWGRYTVLLSTSAVNGAAGGIPGSGTGGGGYKRKTQSLVEKAPVCEKTRFNIFPLAISANRKGRVFLPRPTR